MASATVMLKEGKSYTFTDGPLIHKFTQTPVTVTGRELIDQLKAISCLAVEEHEDKPVTPLAKAPVGKRPAARASQPPPPPPEPEEEPEEDDGDPEPEEEQPADEGEPEAPAEDEEVVEEVADEPEPTPAPKAKGKPGSKGKKG